MKGTFYAQNDLNFEFRFDTSLVTDLSYMFQRCSSFNNGGQPLILDLPEALNLISMFSRNSSFNQSVTLNAPNAVILDTMFYQNYSFNQEIVLTLPKAESLYGMFVFCYEFNNGDQADSSTKPLILDLPEALDLSYMFAYNFNFNQEIKITAPKVTQTLMMFGYCESFNNGAQPLFLDLPAAQNLSSMFLSNSDFNQEVTLLAPKAESLYRMFTRCESFNNGDQAGSSTKPLILNLPEAIEFNQMFSYNFSFNQEIKITAPKVNNISYLLYNCTLFNNGGQQLMLDLPEAIDLTGMFENDAAFNQTLILTAPKAQNLSSMFNNCTDFNNGGQYFTNNNGKFLGYSYRNFNGKNVY